MRKHHTKSIRSEGFTLVITISLLVLLTLIAIGLLSLSSVTLRSSGQGNAAQVARANARMALMLAIGQLQREMGPDSRISAPFDAGSPANARSQWTAVYDAWRNPANGGTPLTPQSRNVRLRSWLVSGDGTANNGAQPIGMVRNASLGSNAAVKDLVVVDPLNVSGSQGQGQIAWWTADESMKAKLTAGAATEHFAAATRPLFDAQSPRFVGARAMPELSGFEWSPKQRSAVVSTDTVNLAANLSGPGIGNFSHDVTVHSLGVLTDVREGRLKRDLTNLLTRSINEAEDKPFYLANGRMNRFVIGANGSVTNASYIPANPKANGTAASVNPRTADEWGINLEELFLFHNVHREISWSGNQPRIVSKNSREAAVADRYYLYRQPVIEATQFILSLRAVADPSNPGRFKMQMMIDGMVCVSNPNDIGFDYAPGLQLALQLLRVPYRLTWDIRRSGTVVNGTTPPVPSNLEYFRGYVGGGPASANALGFSLQPGEAGVFGSTTGTGYILSLQRGFVPSGGVQMNESDYPLNASGLLPTDTINFRMERTTGTVNNNKYSTREFGSNVWTYNNFWIGPRAFNGVQGWHMGAMVPFNAPVDTAYVNERFPLVIQPSQVRPVSDFVNRPQPFMLVSFLRNVEQDSATGAPDALPSRPYLMNEPANSIVGMPVNDLANYSHVSQIICKVEPLPYQFRTLAAGAGGRSLYHGGSRQPNLGGSLNVIKRRIPLAPPLSIGAFENAIASGFARRFRDAFAIGDGTDPFPASARALNGEAPATPVVTKAIGNSYASPFLAPTEVYRSVSLPSGGTDHSWMINNALWDSWFLSGIVDGRGLGGNAFQPDSRSPRVQFNDLVRGTGLLRNERFVFYPFRNADTALTDLFTGDVLRPSAINDLSRYLMVDGAFNVNSTSPMAWKALLASVRGQELLIGGGGRKSYNHPYGTLGYAQTDSITNDWTGLRDLSESELESLANAIVDEVRARGPFLNLADFVNRRPNSSVPAHRAVGALQAAIDRSGLNNRFTGGARSVTAANFGNLPGAATVATETAPARAAGSAGHLTQARLLTALGPQITARGDTFVIRSYGDARDSAGNITARAWCEAVVQRLPVYLDPADLPEAADGWPSASSRLRPLNALFGRRMEIRSFRWLNSEEI